MTRCEIGSPNVSSKTLEKLVDALDDKLQRERDELLDLMRKLVDGDVGQNTLWKLSQGQGTETADGKTWLAAEAVVNRANSPTAGRMSDEQANTGPGGAAVRARDGCEHG